MDYATLTEHNEWEGETWRFYIPITGNETALSEMRTLVDQIDESFHLDLVPITERDVDARVAAPDGNDYMHGHNKLSGRLTIPTLDVGSDPDDDYVPGWFDALYKGGVKDWMESCLES